MKIFKNKKVVTIIVIVIMCIVLLTGCSYSNANIVKDYTDTDTCVMYIITNNGGITVKRDANGDVVLDKKCNERE